LQAEHTILISDRNRHVREFLKREMTAEGYRVRLARNAREVMYWAYQPERLDLIILDSDLPDAGELGLLEKLENRIPALPVVVHGFYLDYAYSPTVMNAAAFVEKRGNSVERLKKVVLEILQKPSLKQDHAPKDGKGPSAETG
jgi:DNA-binding NtrC family response regulator